MPMQAYATAALTVNDPVQPTRTRRPCTLRERLGFTWERNPNYEHGQYAKLRAKHEYQLHQAWKERDAVVIALRKQLSDQAADPRMSALLARLQLTTLESLGVEWYTPHAKGGGKAKQRPYISGAAEQAACAFIAAVRAGWRLVARATRREYAIGQRVLAGFLAAVRRDQISDRRSDPPHLPASSLSLSRERQSTSDAPLPEWLRKYPNIWRAASAADAM